MSSASRWVAGLALFAATIGIALVARRGASTRAATTTTTLAASEDAGIDPRFLVSGCATVVRGGACELGDGDVVRVWAPYDASLVAFAADGAPIAPASAIAVGGGSLVELHPATSARAIEARRDGARVFTLTLVRAAASPPSVVEAKALRKEGKLEAAAERLAADRARAERDGDAWAVLALLARVTRGRGHDDEADALFDASMAAAERSGRGGDAAMDAFALAHSLVGRSRFAEARRVLERAERLARGSDDATTRVFYYRGYLDKETGDARAALRDYRVAAERTERLGLARLSLLSRMEIAKELDAVGRTAEALDDLQPLLTTAKDVAPCDLADLHGTIGWIALHQPPPAKVDPRPWLVASLDLDRRECPTAPDDPFRVADTLGDLAEAELAAGRTKEARARLREATALAAHPNAELAFEWTATRGRIALAERNPREALAAFGELATKAATVSAPGWQVVAFEGSAEADALIGDREAAVSALSRVDELVEAQSTAIPLGEGRESFMAAHAQAEVRRVELLVAMGRADEALHYVRHARGRLLAGLESADRLASLDAAARAKWDDAVGAYRRERDAIDSDAADDWKLAKETLAARQAARSKRASDAQAALDGALATIVARPGATTDEPAPEADGTLVLAYFPASHGWLAFAREGAHARVADLGAIDRDASPDMLATAMLGPFRAEIDRARRIEIVAAGEAQRVDVHALPWEGAPLVAKAPIAYPIDRRRADDDDARAAHHALVVADPTSDLRGARADLDVVTGALAKDAWQTSVLRGGSATGNAVRDGLASAELFQYAGHGRFAGRDGSESALPLAEHGELAVTDILALPHAPHRVVLLGCETARDSGEGRVEGLGLAHAFLVAGSRGVIAATREVNDGATAALTVSLYAHGPPSADLAESLRAAQREAWEKGITDWSAFRVLVP